jgi:hypothetical protein
MNPSPRVEHVITDGEYDKYFQTTAVNKKRK